MWTIDDQYRNPNMNNKDHLVGQLIRGPQTFFRPTCTGPLSFIKVLKRCEWIAKSFLWLSTVSCHQGRYFSHSSSYDCLCLKLRECVLDHMCLHTSCVFILEVIWKGKPVLQSQLLSTILTGESSSPSLSQSTLMKKKMIEEMVIMGSSSSEMCFFSGGSFSSLLVTSQQRRCKKVFSINSNPL